MKRKAIRKYKQPEYPKKEDFDIRKLYRRGRITKKGIAALSMLASFAVAGCGTGEVDLGSNGTIYDALQKIVDYIEGSSVRQLEGDVAYYPIDRDYLFGVCEKASENGINYDELYAARTYADELVKR